MDTLTEIPSITSINKNFVIKWRKTDEDSTWNRLIGAGKYADKFGSELRDKHFVKAMNSLDNKIEIRIRGSYIITFASR